MLSPAEIQADSFNIGYRHRTAEGKMAFSSAKGTNVELLLEGRRLQSSDTGHVFNAKLTVSTGTCFAASDVIPD